MSKGIVLGICGREGAGKTTIANFLCGDTVRVARTWNVPPGGIIPLVAQILLGQYNSERDPIWGLTLSECVTYFTKFFREHIGNLDLDSERQVTLYLPVHCSPWIEMTLAEPLKQIVAILLDLDHQILLAETPENRLLREKVTREYSVCGKKTGREFLEFIGTDLLRNRFDQEIWIKIFQRESRPWRDAGVNIICSDIRFPNETVVLEDGYFLVVYRRREDLVLTTKDKAQHPAKWMFLTFYSQVPNLLEICNDSTLWELYEKIRLTLVKAGL